MRRRKGRDPQLARGEKRMRELGYKLVRVWLDAGEFLACSRGARRRGLALATFLRAAASEWYDCQHARPRPVQPGIRSCRRE
jgi:hypothetical protein